MANHKRGRPKQQRAGCLFCKPHKGNGTKGMRSSQTRQEVEARISTFEQTVGGLYDSFWDEWEDTACDCSVCCDWEENLSLAAGALPRPLTASLRLPRSFRS